jgi:hypothetical protein
MNFNPDLNQIRAFWQQIEQTLDQLLNSQQDMQFDADSLLDTYRDTLRKIDRNLTFHFEREHEEGPVEMIFGAAPQLSGINFRAFNHRYDPVPSCVNLGEEYCDIEEFWCSLRVIEGKLHLAIYLQELPQILEMDPRVEAVMIFMDALIGEYELMTRIWALDWYELPVDPIDFGLIPLQQLREAFDRLKDDVKPVGITIH